MADRYGLKITVAATNLPEPTRAALEAAVARYGSQLLADAEALELARQFTPGPPMITNSMIDWAAARSMIGPLRRPRTKQEQTFAFLERVFFFVSGCFASYLLQGIVAVICSVAFFVLAIICWIWEAKR